MLPDMRSDARSTAEISADLPLPGIGSRSDWMQAGAANRMFRDGRLRRVAHDRWVDAETEDAEATRLLCSLLPEDGVLGGWAAAVLHGVRGAGPDMPGASAPAALAYRTRHDNKKVPGFDILRCDLLPGEATVLDGITVTTLVRTAYDMARFSRGLPDAVATLDQFAFAHNASPLASAPLREITGAHPKSRGNPRVRAAAELMSDRSRSAAESRLRVRWASECGIDPAGVLVNATLRNGDATVELDLVDLSSGLVGEYDGPHHGTSEQRSRDSRKDALVDEMGLTMQRYNAPELRLGPTQFTRFVLSRRDRAVARGGGVTARQLMSAGLLVEEPLIDFGP